MPTTLPVNPYCDVFDFKAIFDLTTGRILFDISPTVFKDVSGFIGVSLEITTPAGVYSPQGYVIDSTDPAKVVEITIPKLKGVYRWGNYNISATIVLQGSISGTETKNVFLSPPDCLGDINGIKGTINLSVDCVKGAIIGRGFTGYAYQGKMPIQEVWDITHYYPIEAELPAKKDITKVPFVEQAYEGQNKFKGTNYSTYDLGNNVFVIVEITADDNKTVRCLIDYDVLFCAVQNELKSLRGCGATPADYNKNLSEINALLWTVTAGTADGKDVDEEIARLEQLLGVDCSCQACAGKRVGEDVLGLPISTVPSTTIPNIHEFKEGEFSQEFN